MTHHAYAALNRARERLRYCRRERERYEATMVHDARGVRTLRKLAEDEEAGRDRLRLGATRC